MFIRYHQVKLVYMVRFLYDQDKKDAKIQKFLHYFVAHGILITVQEKEEGDFQKLIHKGLF